jgi:hypothetical protein
VVHEWPLWSVQVVRPPAVEHVPLLIVVVPTGSGPRGGVLPWFVITPGPAGPPFGGIGGVLPWFVMTPGPGGLPLFVIIGGGFGFWLCELGALRWLPFGGQPLLMCIECEPRRLWLHLGLCEPRRL